jgi:hypothetical protein
MKAIKLLCISGSLAIFMLVVGSCKTEANKDEQPELSKTIRVHEALATAREDLTEGGPFLTQVFYLCDSNQAEPTYQGVTISRWIQTNTVLNPKQLHLVDLLTLKPISFDEEWGTARFELPLKYDAPGTTNHFGGDVDLGSLNNDGDFVPCRFEDCERGTNGNCILWWDINWDSPGKHDLRARLSYQNGSDPITIIGPPMVFYSSNVCQFIEGATFFDSDGAQLYANLRSLTAEFRVELTTSEGKHLKTITGTTTSGHVTNEWNLLDGDGKKFEGDAFVATFHVKYPDDKASHPPARVTFTRIADPIANDPKN